MQQVKDGGGGDGGSKAEIPVSTLVLSDKKTGCTVYLVGCFHGSRVSEDDVTTVFEQVGHDGAEHGVTSHSL